MSGSAPSIMEFSTDLNDQEAPKPLPTGEYTAEVTQALFKVSQNSGNTYLSVSFTIHPEHYPADFTEGDPEGTTLSYNRLVVDDKPSTRYRVKKFLQAVGAKVGRTLDPNDLLGLSATVVVGHEDYEGEPRATIVRVIAG